MNHSPILSFPSSLPPGLTKAWAESPSGGSQSTIAIQIPALISHCHAAYWKERQPPASEPWHTFMSSHYSISAPIRPSRKLMLLVALLWGLPIVWGRHPCGSTCWEHPLQGRRGHSELKVRIHLLALLWGRGRRSSGWEQREEWKALIFHLCPIPSNCPQLCTGCVHWNY